MRPDPVLHVKQQAAQAGGGAAAAVELVAEAAGRPVGRLTLRAAIGTLAPRWWYHVGCAVHAAAELGLFRRQPTLLLGNDLTGASELADITLANVDGIAARAVLDVLMQAAVDLVRMQPHVYGGQLIAELPGRRDEQHRSVFWQGLGAHFYAGDPDTAARRLGQAMWRQEVAALLPRQLVYTMFLPAEAQAAIGAVHPHAEVVRDALEAAGLRFAGHVCIDDGGAVLEATVAG